MNARHRTIAAGLIVAIAAAVAMMLFLGRGGEPAPAPLPTHLAGLMEILPADVTPEQREEIEGILRMYTRRARRGEVLPGAEQAIARELSQYLEAGAIEREALHRLLARISTATHGIDLEHPLLEPDSLSRDGS